jgi:hypothetical protein
MAIAREMESVIPPILALADYKPVMRIQSTPNGVAKTPLPIVKIAGFPGQSATTLNRKKLPSLLDLRASVCMFWG